MFLSISEMFFSAAVWAPFLNSLSLVSWSYSIFFFWVSISSLPFFLRRSSCLLSYSTLWLSFLRFSSLICLVSLNWLRVFKLESNVSIWPSFVVITLSCLRFISSIWPWKFFSSSLCVLPDVYSSSEILSSNLAIFDCFSSSLCSNALVTTSFSYSCFMIRSSTFFFSSSNALYLLCLVLSSIFNSMSW